MLLQPNNNSAAYLAHEVRANVGRFGVDTASELRGRVESIATARKSGTGGGERGPGGGRAGQRGATTAENAMLTSMSTIPNG